MVLGGVEGFGRLGGGGRRWRGGGVSNFLRERSSIFSYIFPIQLLNTAPPRPPGST